MLGATDTTNIATVELARFLLPSRWQESVIGMFGAYFDESGTGTQSPMMAVAGFVARSSVGLMYLSLRGAPFWIAKASVIFT